MALPGCGWWNANIRGDKYTEDEFSTMGRRMRTPDKYNEPFGVSNKALQIERDLGVE